MPRKLSKLFFPASLCLAGCPIDPFLPPCASQESFPASLVPSGCPNGPFLPPWCLSGCPNGPFLLPWCLPEQHFKAQSVLRAAGRGAHPRIYREPGRSPLKLLDKIWRLLKTGIRSAILCYKSPRCLPGASEAVQSGSFPGASLVPRRLSN